MFEQYDIASGESLDPEPAVHETAMTEQEVPTLRLMTVEEAIKTERRRIQLPADIATLPVAYLLSRWG